MVHPVINTNRDKKNPNSAIATRRQAERKEEQEQKKEDKKLRNIRKPYVKGLGEGEGQWEENSLSKNDKKKTQRETSLYFN